MTEIIKQIPPPWMSVYGKVEYYGIIYDKKAWIGKDIIDKDFWITDSVAILVSPEIGLKYKEEIIT